MEVIRTSKRRHPRTPALVLTAHASVQAATEALRCRADDFLEKPLEPRKFLGKVEELILKARRTPGTQRVLAIGAHFDDVEIGCGGLLCRHALAGDQITSLVLTDGACGGASLRRRRESELACARFRGKLITGGLPDTSLSSGPETINAIARVIGQTNPTVVYTHTRFDTHQDHRSTHDATIVATRGVGSLFCYQSPSTTTEFRPTRFVDIGDQLEAKLELLRSYESQLHRAYMEPDVIRSTARYWGRFSGYGHVEALEVIRAVEDGSALDSSEVN